MKKIRLVLGIIICKLLVFIGKLTGKKGSSLPGQIASKICPDMLTVLSKQISGSIICTLGTNGKTTTNNMIDLLIRSGGSDTVCNNVGANMLYGVVTAFASSANISGKLKAQNAVIEIDEASAKIVFRYLTPDYVVLTNLFRDQLDRYGDVDMTAEHIRKALVLAPQAVLILNSDDPICKYLGDTVDNKTVTFGISQCILPQTEESGNLCFKCGNELSYEYHHYSQLGNYKCPSCGFERGKPDFEATDIDCRNKVSFTLCGNERINSNTYGFYNIYNILAAISAVKTAGIETLDFTKAFMKYKPQIARMEEFIFGDKTVILNLAKNPAGFNQAIYAVNNDERKKSVIIAINDCESDGVDISWLYDVDFESLKDGYCNYGVSGKRKFDMALRLFYGDVCEEPDVSDEPVELAEKYLKTDVEVIYLLVNYTVMFDAENRLKKLHKEYIKNKKAGQ